MSINNNKEIIGVVILVALFPVLWVYNQKINYRSIFQYDERFLLKAPSYQDGKLYSIYKLSKDLKNVGLDVSISPKIVTSSQFTVLGRVINIDNLYIEVYEYESFKQATDTHKLLNINDTHVINNLIVYNKSGIGRINDIIKGISNE
jgi:hypothetical protein